MKVIICKTDGAEIMVDDEDYHLLTRFPWYRGGVGEHPMTFLYGKNGKGRPVYMHQLIMGGAVNTDHHDLNVMNMQKDNLRVATHQLNGWNKGKATWESRPPTSQYKGVSYRPLRGKPRWLAHFKYVEEGKHKSTGRYVIVGYFWNEIEAAKAYNKKIKEMRGEYAWVNPIPEEAS
jgi:hypothetical protein